MSYLSTAGVFIAAVGGGLVTRFQPEWSDAYYQSLKAAQTVHFAGHDGYPRGGYESAEPIDIEVLAERCASKQRDSWSTFWWSGYAYGLVSGFFFGGICGGRFVRWWFSTSRVSTFAPTAGCTGDSACP